METQRSFRAITNFAESRAAFQLLKARVEQDGRGYVRSIGFQGGSVRRAAHWLPNVGIWAVIEEVQPDFADAKRPRFWNCFGIGSPEERGLLAITLEINPPHEGDNPRVAGLFVTDEADRVYIAHTGRVGGGRKGIGPSRFRECVADVPWREVRTQGGSRMVVILGPIDAPDFFNQLASYVHKVAHFKESVAPSRSVR